MPKADDPFTREMNNLEKILTEIKEFIDRDTDEDI